MAYASLYAEVRGDTSHLESKLVSADNLMKQVADRVRVVSFRMNDSIFAQINNVKAALGGIGRHTAHVDVSVNGVPVAVSNVKEVNREIKAATNNVELMHKGIKDMGAGAFTGLKTGMHEVNKMFGDDLAAMEARAFRFKQKFARSVGVDEITRQIGAIPADLESRGFNVAGMRAQIAELSRVLELEREIKANRNLDFKININPDGVASLQNIKLLLDGTERAATRTEQRLAALRAAAYTDKGRGGADVTRYSFGDETDFARFQNNVKAAEARANSLKREMASVRAQIEAALSGAGLGGTSRGLLDHAFGNPNDITARSRQIIAAINEFKAALAQADKYAVVGKANAMTGSSPLETLQRQAVEYRRVANEAHEAAIKQRALAQSLGELERKGYGAFAGMLRGLSDVDRATARANAKLNELAGAPAAASRYSPAYGSAQAAQAQAQLAAIKQQLREAGLSATQVLGQKPGLDPESLRRYAAAAREVIGEQKRLDNEQTRGAATAQRLRTEYAALAVEARRFAASSGVAAPGVQTGNMAGSITALRDYIALSKVAAGGVAGDIMPGKGAAVAADFERVNKVIQNSRKSLEQVNAEIAKFEARTNALARGSALRGTQLAQTMRAAAENIDRADRASGGLAKSLMQVYNTIVRWALGYFVVSGLIQGFQALKTTILDYNALLEKSRIAFTTMMAGNEKRADSFLLKLREFAKVTPYEFKNLVPLTQRLIALGLVAENEVEKKAIPALTAIGNAVAAIGGDASLVDRITLALGQMVQKGKASSEEVTRQLAEAGINGAKYLAQAMGKTVPEIFTLMKKGMIDGKKAAEAILYGMANDPKYKDMMAKFSQTFEGALSNVRDWSRDTIAGAFKPLFDDLRDRLVNFAKLTNSTKFKLDFDDRLQGIKDTLNGIASGFRNIYGWIVRLNLIAPALFLLIASLANGSPYLLLAVAIGRFVITIVNLASRWDELNAVAKVGAVVLGVFGAAMTAIQIQNFITSMAAATGSVTIFSAMAARSSVVLNGLLMANGVRSFSNLLPNALAGVQMLIASTSMLALVAIPALLAVITLGAAAWQNYRSRQMEADIANHNLAISIDSVSEAIKKMSAATASSPAATKAVSDMADRFEKAKASAGSLVAFMGRFGGKAFENDLRFGAKLDETQLSEVLAQRDEFMRRANRMKNDLIIKAQVKDDPHGWDALKANFRDAEKNADNWFYWIIRGWNNLDKTIREFSTRFDTWVAHWVRDNLGDFGAGLNWVIDRARALLNLPPIDYGPAIVATQQAVKTMEDLRHGPPEAPGAPANREAAAAKARMGVWFVTSKQIEGMNLKQLQELRGKWSAEAAKNGDFWKKHGLESARSALVAREAALKAMAPDPSFKPTENKDADAEKAKRAALKLEKDRLTDIATAQENLARVTEDSAKRQLTALKSVGDVLRGILGGLQDQLGKFGITTSPLDAVINRVERLANLGPKMLDVARNAGAAADNYRQAALNAKGTLDTLNGGDGNEPGYAAKVGAPSAKPDPRQNLPHSQQIKLIGRDGLLPWERGGSASGGDGAKEASNAMLLSMAKSFTSGEPYLSCAFVASRLANAVGANIKPSSSAGQLRQNAMAAGWGLVDGPIQRGDLIFNRRKGGSGYHVKTGADDGYVVNSNHREETMYRYKPRAGDEVYRSGSAGAGGSRVPGYYGAAGKGAMNIAMLEGGDLIAQLQEQLKELSLSKLAPIPAEFGKAIEESEGHAARFAVQMQLADRNTQSLLRARMGNQFPALIRLLAEAADLTDQLASNARGKVAIRDLRKTDRNRGKENNPIAQLEDRFKEGGDLAGADMQTQLALWWQTRTNTINDAVQALGKLRNAQKDSYAQMNAGAAFIQRDTVDTYNLARAQELLAKKIDLARSAEMVRLYNTDRAEYNKQLAIGVDLITRLYDYEKAIARTRLMATARQELGERNAQLKAQIALIEDATLSEIGRSEALARQAYYFDQLKKLRDAGFTKERSRELAAELTALNANNLAIEKQNGLLRASRQIQEEAARATAAASDLASIYGSTAYGSEAQNRALKEKAERETLAKRIKAGEFDITTFSGGQATTTRDHNSIWAEVAAAKERVDAAISEEKTLAQSAAIDQSRVSLLDQQNQLVQKQLEISGGLSDAGRAFLDLQLEIAKRQGTTNAMTAQELANREAILDLMRQAARADHANQMRELRDQAESLGLADDKNGDKRTEFMQSRRMDRIREQIAEMTDELNFAYLFGDDAEVKRLQTIIDDLHETLENAGEKFDLETVVKEAQRAADAVQAAWESITGSVTSGIDTAIRTSGSLWDRLEAGAASATASIADYFLKMAEQILANYIITQLLGAIPGAGGFFSVIQQAANAGPVIPGAPKSGGNGPAPGVMAGGGSGGAPGASGAGVAIGNATFVFPNVRTSEDAAGIADETVRQAGSMSQESRRTTATRAADLTASGSVKR